MRITYIALLALAVCNTGAFGQTFYRERITTKGDYNGSSETPHDQPVTHVLTGNAAFNGWGRNTVTFASTPAPFVQVLAEAGGNSNTAVVGANLDYEFFVKGPADAFVPINFMGRFDVQNNSYDVNRSEVFFGLSVFSMDFQRGDSLTAVITCDSGICRTFLTPGSGGLTSIQVAMNAHEPSASPHPVGTFSGTALVATDASGMGRATVNLGAFATGFSSLGSSSAGHAFIDPQFSIDPTYLALHPDSGLTFPVGVGNAIAAVPEPATGVSLAAGLVALLLSTAKRRRPLPA